MLISSSCTSTPTSSEEGCFPLAYIAYAGVFIIFVILLISLLSWRRHKLMHKTQRTGRDRSQDIDLEERAHSRNTYVSPPPSYHSRRGTLVNPAPVKDDLPEPKYKAKEQDIVGSNSWSTNLKRWPDLSITVPKKVRTDIELMHGHEGVTLRPASIDVARHNLEPTRDSLDLSFPDGWNSNPPSEEKIGVAR